MPRSAILFDLDGTLVDSARDIAAALTRLSVERGGQAVAVDRVRPLVSLGAATLVATALGPVADDPQQDLAAFRALLRDAPSDPAIVYPDVEWALAALVDAGWRLAVVTNKPESLAVALLHTHCLDRFFACVAGGDTAARAKPDPAPLRHALAALGATPEIALFVGDSEVDAAAAAALAIPLLLYAGGYGVDAVAEKDAAGRFDGFADLPALAAAHR
ncbi:HAD family hydrolase [Sphingomonas sp.]|uniref:HAD family hydrolase n=1 Tax=Sphingomonas sp. TaxID=28214 RepID=UPI0035BBB493